MAAAINRYKDTSAGKGREVDGRAASECEESVVVVFVSSFLSSSSCSSPEVEVLAVRAPVQAMSLPRLASEEKTTSEHYEEIR
jgi:hypothetical protein